MATPRCEVQLYMYSIDVQRSTAGLAIDILRTSTPRIVVTSWWSRRRQVVNKVLQHRLIHCWRLATPRMARYGPMLALAAALLPCCAGQDSKPPLPATLTTSCHGVFAFEGELLRTARPPRPSSRLLLGGAVLRRRHLAADPRPPCAGERART